MEKECVFDGTEFKEMDEERKYNMIVKYMKESVLLASGKSREGLKENLDEKGKRKVRYQIRKNNPCEWWDAECREAIENRKKALKKFKRNRILENWIEFKRCKAVARKTINRKKRKFY